MLIKKTNLLLLPNEIKVLIFNNFSYYYIKCVLNVCNELNNNIELIERKNNLTELHLYSYPLIEIWRLQTVESYMLKTISNKLYENNVITNEKYKSLNMNTLNDFYKSINWGFTSSQNNEWCDLFSPYITNCNIKWSIIELEFLRDNFYMYTNKFFKDN